MGTATGPLYKGTRLVINRRVRTAGLQRGLGRTFAALREQQFRYLWFGMFFSMAAMQINIVARGWLAFDISDSALILGVVMAARSLPQLMLAPLGGVLADRMDKRILLIVSQCVLFVVAMANAILVHMGTIEIWHLFVLGIVQGITQPFNMPTRTALIPDLVSDNQVSNALALDSTGRNINRITAPALAGLLLAINPMLAFYASAIFYAAAVITLLNLPRGLRGISSSAARKGTFAEMGVGFQYIWGHRSLFALMAMAFVVVILGMPFQQLLPVFQKDVLDVGPQALGLMFTAVGVGAIIGSLVAAYTSERPDMGRMQLGAGILFGISLMGFAMSTNFMLSLALLVFVGFASQGYMTINRVLVMRQTERHLYGRVMSIYMMTWALVPAALLPIGFVVDIVGVGATVSVAGLILTLCLVSVAFKFPQIYMRDVVSVNQVPRAAD